MIAIAGVTRSYDGRRVLGPLTLDVPTPDPRARRPERLRQSTLLRLVVGFSPRRRHDRGRRDELTPATRDRLRLGMGYVIQEGRSSPTSRRPTTSR
jgi:hypothetical protein